MRYLSQWLDKGRELSDFRGPLIMVSLSLSPSVKFFFLVAVLVERSRNIGKVKLCKSTRFLVYFLLLS